MGVLIKIKAPSDSKFEGSPSNLSTPTPIHPQIITTKLNIKYKDNYNDAAYSQMSVGGKMVGLPQDTGPLVYL